MHLTDPTFPPLLTGYAVKAPLQPFTEACRLAAFGELGAGDLVWSRNTSRAAAAIVLEPDVTRNHSLQMLPLLQLALGDALGSLVPPQCAIQFRWPHGILVNGGVAGATAIALAPCESAQIPDWLVAGFDLELSGNPHGREPGYEAGLTTMVEEGVGDVSRTQIIEAFGSHLMMHLHIWGQDGFRGLHDHWLGRMEGCDTAVSIAMPIGAVAGRILGLDDCVNLIVASNDGTRLLPLFDHLRESPMPVSGRAGG